MSNVPAMSLCVTFITILLMVTLEAIIFCETSLPLVENSLGRVTPTSNNFITTHILNIKHIYT